MYSKISSNIYKLKSIFNSKISLPRKKTDKKSYKYSIAYEGPKTYYIYKNRFITISKPHHNYWKNRYAGNRLKEIHHRVEHVGHRPVNP